MRFSLNIFFIYFWCIYLSSIFCTPKACDTLGDYIRRSPRSAKIARCVRCSDCDFRRSPRSAYKIADISHVRYRRLNSPALAKCARSRDFLRLLLRIASKANPSGWAICHMSFQTATSPRSVKNIARCVHINRQLCRWLNVCISKFALSLSKVF